MSCFGRSKYAESEDEMTVVYRIEPLNENEAAFLPQDLPEVVLDASHMATDAETLLAESKNRVQNGKVRPSNYSEHGYSPEIYIMPMTPVKKKAASTINRTASLESVHLLQQQRKYRRPMTPNYIPVGMQSRYGSELGMSTYNYPAQGRRQYLVPYKPTYTMPQAYHYSLPGRSNPPRVYRQPSNAESYTLSRPPGRAQPIRIVPQESQPIMTRNIGDITATHLMEQETYRNTLSQPRPKPSNFQNISSTDGEPVIEAALEPPRNASYVSPYPSPPKRSSRTHVKDIQYHASDVATSTTGLGSGTSSGGGKTQLKDFHFHDISNVATSTTGLGAGGGGGVEISPVSPPEGGQESEEWQEISLYVRRPSLEDVRRVRPQGAENVRSNVHETVATTTTTAKAMTGSGELPRSERSGTPRMRSHGQKIITTTNQAPRAPRPVSAPIGQNYMYRTTIPRNPQPRQKSVPMIMVNDEAMQF